MVEDIPFVDTEGAVHHDGALVMPLTITGDTTTSPSDHTAHFVGGVPCDANGAALTKIINNTEVTKLDEDLVAACYFSAKRPDGVPYADFYEKVTMYVSLIAPHAAELDSTATAKRFRPVAATEDDPGPFNYTNTASSRVGLDAINAKLAGERIGIIGGGGTAGYVLDLVSKTEVETIDQFDADRFYAHNAFRAPGAASIEQLNEAPYKVDYLAGIYSKMHRRITPHPVNIDNTTVELLRELTFVFVAIDDGPAKKAIMEALIEFGIPFIDVGMGVQLIDDKLTGLVRTTTVTPAKSDHVADRIPVEDAGADDDYRTNIQIAELNALNAVHAVIRWKQYRGVYADIDGAHHSTYSIATNHIVNDDKA